MNVRCVGVKSVQIVTVKEDFPPVVEQRNVKHATGLEDVQSLSPIPRRRSDMKIVVYYTDGTTEEVVCDESRRGEHTIKFIAGQHRPTVVLEIPYTSIKKLSFDRY